MVASAYPGTPSTEILENIAAYRDELYCEWAPNEKVAVEVAIGASIVGARSLAAMKHVGVNVAADPLFTFSYTGVNGGFVIVSADDPYMHSSQNEQDNRHYARAAKLCMLEPSDSQEARDMTILAYEISEQFDVPVMLRMTTRVCHSKSIVEIGKRKTRDLRPYVKNRNKYDAVPEVSRRLHKCVEQRLAALREYAETSPLNFTVDNGTKIGVVASGIGYQYAREAFGERANYFKVGLSFPLPVESIRRFAQGLDMLYVVEELEPFIEEQLKAAGIPCVGKEKLPVDGEYDPALLRRCLLEEETPTLQAESPLVGRAPTLCAGCPHRGVMLELGKIPDLIISGDIGCYALGGGEPYHAKDCTICMGASISMAHGMKKAFASYGRERKVVSIIGDSTFFHTGINSLEGAVYNKGTALTIILDNRITGMTGHQENPGTGYTLMGESTEEISIEKVVRAMGVKHVRVINPLCLSEVREALSWGLAQEEAAVLITRYPCALKKYRPEEKEEFGTLSRCTVDTEKCIGCRACLKTGCPAVTFDKNRKKAGIEREQCTGCGICAQVCPVHAIGK